MSQYTLDLSWPPLFTADNFFISDCNREAWQWVEVWPNWPAHALLLYGPPACGKSHLGQVWAARTQASIIQASALGDTPPGGGHWLIEDIEHASTQARLLHWFNYTREQGVHLLLTSRLPAAQLPFTLPDLTSRLLAIPTVAIHQPDDEVLAGAIRKQFADRQLPVEEGVIIYALSRMERSLAGVGELVALLDRTALAEHKAITIPLVKRLLDSQMQTEPL